MPAWLDRIATRAATGTTVAGRLSGAGAGLDNSISGAGTGGKGPVKAATGNVTYATLGMPQPPAWSARNAVENGYYQNIWVMRCARTIADTLAALPFRAGMNPGRPGDYNPHANLARFLGPATPQAPAGPNTSTSSRAFWAWSVVQYLITGRFAWELQTDPQTKQINGLWPLVSAYLDPIPSHGSTRWWDGFTYHLPTGDISLKPDRVFYAWRPSARDWREPESVLEAAALPISVSIGIERYVWSLLKNNMVGTTIVTTPPFEEPEMRRAWQDSFVAEFTGFDKAGKTIFAELEGDPKATQPSVQVQRLAETATDAQLIALNEQAKVDITVALGVPESLIGNASQKTFSNADSEYRNFWTITMLPFVAEMQDAINTSLAPLLGDEVGWFDLSKVVALQPPSLFAPPAFKDLIDTQVITASEARNLLGVASMEIPGVDVQTAMIGEEALLSGAQGTGSSAGKPGQASAPAPETRGYDRAEAILDRVERLRVERRTPQTPTASTVPEPVGPAPLWKHPGWKLPPYIEHLANDLIGKGRSESEAIAMAVGVVKDWAAGHTGAGQKVHADVQAAAARNIAQWESLKASAGGRRDVGGIGGALLESSSAGDLLPQGQPIPPHPDEATMIGPHRYQATPADIRHCARCGHGPRHSLHTSRTGKRHAGPGHAHVPTGHTRTRRERAARKATHVADLDGFESGIAETMRGMFDTQANATVSRLSGKRGEQMLRRARTDVEARQPSTPPSQPAGGAPVTPGPAVDPAAIFDAAHWADQTARALGPHYSAITALGRSRVRDQLGGEAMLRLTGEADSMSTTAVRAALDARAQTVAAQITRTTFDQIAATLGDGMAGGENIAQLTARVKAVFAEASSVRAEMIARTEANSASQIAQNGYASALPPGIVDGREWLAVHDNRTRPTHRVADGQVQPMGVPFIVGGFPMMFPGDPMAPPDETINCRCGTAFHPVTVSPAAALTAA